MLAIGDAHGALKAPSLESLHPDRDAIGIPVQKLDTIAALIEEHEQAAIAHIALKVILDDAVETIEALAHIDGLAVQVDGYRFRPGIEQGLRFGRLVGWLLDWWP